MTKDQLTKEESFWIDWARILKTEKKDSIYKTFILRSTRFWFDWRSAKSLMGRFGGGWQWRLGIQAGGSTVIIHLLICSMGIERVT